ncbi:hypothetical protein CPB84DRAFT_1679132 [Gymnopilus junonius]|uniref:AAA+ ATPase domain-containing protein n=1 Tax=Gymnopilus junonius TaxID=109634 RepID=A0A9P5TMT5_GYMJU|nr:hypothetical protein CPB84DRAFT_1679132 [Gymnopilus junonius]
MRSQSLLRKSHLLLKHSATVQSNQRSLLFKRTHQAANSLPINRSLSSTAVPPSESDETSSSSALSEAVAGEGKDASEQNVVITEEPEKPSTKPRRTRLNAPSSSSKDEEPLEFPPGLEENILYFPTESVLASESNNGCPPADIFEEALDNLLITLHPQNQHRAMHVTGGSNRPVEPTLGLYCPIEGGDYVIDLTVQELAYQTRAEVLVLDAVQLAAGEWGPFGKAAAAFNLPDNPLHFSSPSPPLVQPSSHQMDPTGEQEEEEASPVLFASPSRMTFTVNRPFPVSQSRALVTPNSRKATPPSKLDTFFENLVNLSFPIEESENPSTAAESRPRLIYIRDFPTLAPSSSLWYPPLLAAVRQRRRRLLSRASNTTSSPVTIIFGMTPPVAPAYNSSAAGSSSNLMNFLMNRSSANSPVVFPTKPEQVHDWSESEAAETAREGRLRSRLKKWEKSVIALQDEFPRLASVQESESTGPIVLIGGEAQMSLPSLFGMPLSLDSGSGSGPVDITSKFFRSSILVPRSRSPSQERETRVARRREINELTIRMGVGAVGGVVDPEPASSALQSVDAPVDQTSDPLPAQYSNSVWDNWGNRIEEWSDVRKIADRAMGSIMVLQQALRNQEKTTLAPTIIPWSAVQAAWRSYHSFSDTRKSWLKETIGASLSNDDILDGKERLLNAGSDSDKLLERIRNDPDLDQHEARLLPCIVDSDSITTTFSQVHLPSHTIDSIRTIVSLPLLHPHAFRQGILKQHSMTGCLLFGPPGTGKTLAVRALAKEAGCRMLAISPSDVMDMYVGEGEKLVRAVFSLARRLSPCVVFLDEIDALFGARMSARDSGGAFAHRGVITEFMQEMDGLKSSKEDNVIVIGATNRPFDLDDAVLRRLPRRLLVDLPGEKERKEILKILLRDESLAEDVNVEALASKTEGFSGSDLKHLCVSAALDSIKEHLDVPWLSRPIAVHATSPVSSPPLISTKSASPNDQTQAPVMEQKSTEAGQDLVLPIDRPMAPSTPSESSGSERILRLRNFTQALKEITPSSSESLGSLSELRKWNDEFGEGRRNRKKFQVWGKGRFGFVDKPKEKPDEHRVPKE